MSCRSSMTPGAPRTTVQAVPPVVDPAKNPQCNNLIFIKVEVNGGAVPDDALQFSMEFTISDYTAHHRAGVALNDALNAIVYCPGRCAIPAGRPNPALALSGV